MNNNTENDLGATSKLDNIAHVQSSMPQDHYPKEDGQLQQIKKTARLAKLNFFITIVGLGTLGYLHFSDKGSVDESLAKAKVALKQEISQGLATKEELQTLNTDLITKIDGQGARISGLEVQGEQFQEEFHRSAQLNARVNELQASMKKSAAAKPAAVDSKNKSKAKPAAKSASKPAKKKK